MYIIPDRKFCYLASQRTASKATAKFLMTEFSAKRTGLHHSFEPGIVDDSWIVCTTVRNHWDVIVSWYFHVKAQCSFDKFVKQFIDTNIYCQEPRLFRHLDYATILLRYETLQEDFNNILEPRQIPIIRDSDRNGQPYQELHTDKTRELIEDYFKDEIALLGYQYND